jgi:predicted DNA-binding antitoxin AbrB/MazE fold protein
MTQRIDAIFENGVFRPEVPISIADGQRVSIDIEPKPGNEGDISDVGDLLDVEFTASCHQNPSQAPSLDEVRKVLSAFEGSLSDRIANERDQR